MIAGDCDSGNMTENYLDFSFLVKNTDEAEKVVDKILFYVTTKTSVRPRTFAFDNNVVFILS